MHLRHCPRRNSHRLRGVSRWSILASRSLTSVQAVVGEDGSCTTLNCSTSHLGASLPDQRSEMEELGNVQGGWGVLAIRNVGSLAIVPLVGDGISNQGREVIGVEITGGAKGSKVLTVSSRTLSPVHVLATRHKILEGEFVLTCHGRRHRC